MPYKSGKHPPGVHHERGSALRGSRHHKAKLSEQDVRDIRAWYATGNTSFWKICLKYDLDTKTVYCLIHRKTWKHVE